jgi:hypothetical protein
MKDVNPNDGQKATEAESGGTGADEHWTLGELEGIVYDFLNFNDKKPVNQEFMETRFRLQDVKKEDMMNIQKLDKKQVEEQPLP